MGSYEFEVICKNALIKKLKELYGEDLNITELHLVWFSKALQNYKCVIVDLRPSNQRYYECTYNGTKKELYVDIYNKEHNILVSENEFERNVSWKGE